MAGLEKNRAVLRMMLGEAAQVPHMKDEDRSAWAEEIRKILESGTPQPVKVVPHAVLKMIGIGIRRK